MFGQQTQETQVKLDPLEQMDPFKSVLEDAENQLGSAQLLLRQYRTKPESSKLADLNNTIQDLSEIIRELTESIAAVQAQPDQFGLHPVEIEQRIEQVGHINRQVTDVQEELSKIRAEAKYAIPDDLNQNDADNNVSAEDRQMLFQSTIQEQDAMFDEVAHTVANLREQADIMSRELEDQAELIDDFEGYVDNTNDRLKRGIKRVDYVLRNNRDCMSNCCIGLLIFVLIVLLAFVVIT